MQQLTKRQLFDILRAAGPGQSVTIPQADVYEERDERLVLRLRAPATIQAQWAPRPPDWVPGVPFGRRPSRTWRPAPVLMVVSVPGTVTAADLAFEGSSDRFLDTGTICAGAYTVELYAPDGAGDTPGWWNRSVDAQIESLTGALQQFATDEGVSIQIGDESPIPPAPPR